MALSPSDNDPIAAVALLDEPNRRRLYQLVAASHEPVGRDEAAAALGMSRELAAFHLDRLADGGLLETEYRRRNGRSGPGAGRPAKLYRRTDREIAVAFPPRRYEVAADLFAEALDRVSDGPTAAAVRDVARERGSAIGTQARQEAGPRPSRRRLLAALLAALRWGGYEPEVEAASGTVYLHNCPFRALSTTHRDLTCGMNHAWAEGVVGGLADSGLRAKLAPAPGYCCVVFEGAAPRQATATPPADSVAPD